MNIRITLNFGVAVLALLGMAACNQSTTNLKEIESQKSNDIVVSLLNDKDDLAKGQNSFVIAFRSASTAKPVDVGRVYVSSTMAMPGMPVMSASIELQPAKETGQYLAKGDFSMSGAWRFEIRWDGPAGQGNVSFSRNVR